MEFTRVQSIVRYCSLFLVVFLQQHVAVNSTRNYTELMKECSSDFCICINRNVDDAEQCPWDPDYFAPTGKVVGTMYHSVFRFLVCKLIDSPSVSDGAEYAVYATIDDVNTTQFVFVNGTNGTVGTERVVAMDDVDVARLFKVSTTYFYGEESLSFTPFDLITCPSTIDTSTTLPTPTPTVAPSSAGASLNDNVRNDTLFGLMAFVIANAFLVSGF